MAGPFSIKTLDRYLLRQMLDFFLLGVVVFTLVVFFSDTFLDFVRDIQKLGVPISASFVLIGLQLPQTVAIVLPASTFMAVMMVYNSLNNHFEIVALRMNGISLGRLLAPALAVGVLVSVFSYLLGDFVVPACNRYAALLKQEMLKKGALPLGRSSFVFHDYDSDHNLQKLIYVSRYEGRKLDASTIIDLSQSGVLQIVQAKSGLWFPDRWEFRNANVYLIVKAKDQLNFDHFGVLKIRNLFQSGEEEEAEANAALRDLGDELNIDSGVQSFASLFSRIKERERRGMRVAKVTYVNLWEKITLPLSCLVMILTAVPLALTPPRTVGGRGFVFSIGILFLYYILRSVFAALGRSESLTLGGLLPIPQSMLVACWLPLLLIGVLGGVMLSQKSRVL